YIWLFQFKSQQWVARSNVANTEIHVTPGLPPHHVQVITAFVGQFGFQIMVGRWPSGRRLALRSPHFRDWDTATKFIWPEPLPRYRWPPSGGYLADDTIEPFMDRFVTDGFPLERP